VFTFGSQFSAFTDKDVFTDFLMKRMLVTMILLLGVTSSETAIQLHFHGNIGSPLRGLGDSQHVEFKAQESFAYGLQPNFSYLL
jgi:hypothetical protein